MFFPPSAYFTVLVVYFYVKAMVAYGILVALDDYTTLC